MSYAKRCKDCQEDDAMTAAAVVYCPACEKLNRPKGGRHRRWRITKALKWAVGFVFAPITRRYRRKRPDAANV